jgi:hypothetical protein
MHLGIRETQRKLDCQENHKLAQITQDLAESLLWYRGYFDLSSHCFALLWQWAFDNDRHGELHYLNTALLQEPPQSAEKVMTLIE